MTIEEFIERLKNKREIERYIITKCAEFDRKSIAVPAFENNDRFSRKYTVNFIFELNKSTNNYELDMGILYKEPFEDYIKQFVENTISYVGSMACGGPIKEFKIVENEV